VNFHTGLRLFRAGVVSLILLLSSLELTAQTSTIPQTVTELPPSSERWALVIGISKYDDPSLNPLFGQNDAKKIAADLERYAGFDHGQVLVLTDDQPADRQPRRERILWWLSVLKQNASPQGLLLVFFSGHGLESQGESFLIPKEAHLNFDRTYLEQNAVPIEVVSKSLREAQAKQIIVLVDACRSNPYAAKGNTSNKMTSKFVDSFDYEKQNSGISAYVKIFSTSPGEESFQYQEMEMGYFSWVLDQALSGVYDQGQLTLKDLIRRLEDEIPRLVKLYSPGRVQEPDPQTGGYKADQLVLVNTYARSLSSSGRAKKSGAEQQPPGPDTRTPIGTDKVLVFLFGVVFILILLAVAVFDRQPSPIGILIYRVVLALAAAGIGAVIPGMIDVNVSTIIRAGGAIALFVIVYWFKPADLVAGLRKNTTAEPVTPPEGIHETSREKLEKLSHSQRSKVFESMERFKSLTGESIDRVFKATEVRRTITVEPPNAELMVFEELTNLSDRDQYQLTRYVTTDAPTAKKTLDIKAWFKRENQECEAAVEISPSSDARIFTIRIGFKGQVVRVGNIVQLRWRSKFPGSVALNEDYWVFPLNLFEKRPNRLVVEALFLHPPADLLFFAISPSGHLNPLSLVGPESRTKDNKPYFAYSASIDGPGDFYVLQWRIDDN
jgi:hypothetical protein